MVTGKKAASEAGKELSKKGSPKGEKAVAGSDLAQVERKAEEKKKKKKK